MGLFFNRNKNKPAPAAPKTEPQKPAVTHLSSEEIEAGINKFSDIMNSTVANHKAQQTPQFNISREDPEEGRRKVEELAARLRGPERPVTPPPAPQPTPQPAPTQPAGNTVHEKPITIEERQAFVSKYSQLIQQDNQQAIQDTEAGVFYIQSYVLLKNQGLNPPGGVRFNFIQLCIDLRPEYAYRINNLMTPDFFVGELISFMQGMSSKDEVFGFIDAIKQRVSDCALMEFSETGTKIPYNDLTFVQLSKHLDGIVNHLNNQP